MAFLIQQTIIKMKKELLRKQHYASPWCKVIEVETANLICASPKIKATPSGPGFTEEDWDNEQTIDDGDENEFE